MDNKHRGFASRGNFGRSKFNNRHSNNGGFNRGFNGNQNRFNNGPRNAGPKSKPFANAQGLHLRGKSKLIGADHSIFIKKAENQPAQVAFVHHNSFADFEIIDQLKRNIEGRGYTHPTPIQDKAITPIIEGRDLIGLANTGTGKTAAFLVPLLNKIYNDKSQKALIITPTRELAAQIQEELKSFAAGLKIYSALLIGGASIRPQIWDLRRNPNVVIGTPGRIKDLMNQRQLFLNEYRTIVLDEVDLMVDIGFIAEVKLFISLLPKERQSLFFSATISPKVREILQAFVSDPVTVSVQQQPTAANVDQDIIRVINRDKKVDQLHDLLNKEEFNKVMVFGRTKHGIEKLDKQLSLRGFSVGSLHGNKSQSQRQRTLRSFKQNEFQVLLATDVAARGLDIDNVSHVINYDLPETYEDYIHRIGRTGRADKKGVALTFVE